jgi:MFS transporter, DHA1 family, multidrug resistance protein
MNLKKKIDGSIYGILGILIFSTAVTIMSTDLYIASMPNLSKYFGTSAEKVSLTLSLAILMFSFSQLVHGPLADRFGRRPVLLYGMGGFTVFTIACTFSQNIESLIFFRVLQAACGSVEAVVGLAIIGDLFYEEDGVKILGIYGMIVAIAPALAPIVGGYMYEIYGWESNFWLLAIFGFILFLCIFKFLPESGSPDKQGLSFKRVIERYLTLFTGRVFITYTLVLSSFFGCLWAFISGGPFLYINYLGVSTKYYGYYQTIIVCFFFAGSVFASKAVAKFGAEKILRFGMLLGFLGSVFLLSLSLLQTQSVILITLAVSVTTFGMGPIFAVAPIKALSGAPISALGSAAALRGTLQLSGAGLGALAGGLVQTGSSSPIAVTMLGLSLFAILIYILVKPWK